MKVSLQIPVTTCVDSLEIVHKLDTSIVLFCIAAVGNSRFREYATAYWVQGPLAL